MYEIRSHGDDMATCACMSPGMSRCELESQILNRNMEKPNDKIRTISLLRFSLQVCLTYPTYITFILTYITTCTLNTNYQLPIKIYLFTLLRHMCTEHRYKNKY